MVLGHGESEKWESLAISGLSLAEGENLRQHMLTPKYGW